MSEPDLKRADFEPYFHAWDSVIHYPNPAVTESLTVHGHAGGSEMMPCYRHRTCGGLVKVGSYGLGKYPPRVCPECGVNTETEIRKDAVPVERDPVSGLVALPPGVRING